MVKDLQIVTYESREHDRPIYIYKFRVRTRRVNKRHKIKYTLYVVDTRSNETFLAVSLRDWYPIIDYLTSDDRYLRGRDYDIVKDRRRTREGAIDLIEIWFYNTECAWRVTAFVLSILGVENKPHWVRRMRYVVRLLSPEAIDFWILTAHDRFVVFKNGLVRRFSLLRLSKAMRTLYEKYVAGGIT